MTEPRESPGIPPVREWFKVTNNPDGSISVLPGDGFYRLIVGERGRTTNVNSGLALAEAAAQAAQATANAAAQQATDVGEAALSFSAAASPANVSGTRLGSGAVTTNATTVTPTGGTGPYTYAWAYVSGDTFTVNSPTSATTTFTTSLTVGQDKSAVYRCTVTDSLAATATATVGVSATELS